jgi:membrane-associated phospholipid phosphatase
MPRFFNLIVWMIQSRFRRSIQALVHPEVQIPMSTRPFDQSIHLLTLSGAALLLTIAAAGDGVLPGDVAVTHRVQQIDFSSVGMMADTVNWAGAGAQMTLLTLAAAVALGMMRRFGAMALILAVLLLRITNPILKAIADSPRPPDHLVQVSEYASGLGFPSGHMMGTVLFYGAVIYLAREQIDRRWLRLGVQAFAGAMIAMTAFGRIHAGAHWPSDVLGGLLWGTIFLLLILRLYQQAQSTLTQRTATPSS